MELLLETATCHMYDRGGLKNYMAILAATYAPRTGNPLFKMELTPPSKAEHHAAIWGSLSTMWGWHIPALEASSIHYAAWFSASNCTRRGTHGQFPCMDSRVQVGRGRRLAECYPSGHHVSWRPQVEHVCNTSGQPSHSRCAPHLIL